MAGRQTARLKSMTLNDRRSGEDRRAIERRNVAIDIEWEGPDGIRRPGSISDLSEAGCFVLSAGEVAEGDTVRLFLPLGEGMKAQLLGEVRNQVYEIGFALKFLAPTDAQKNVIIGLMAKYAEN